MDSDMLNHGVSRQTIYQAAHAASSGRDSVGETSLPAKPLRDDSHGPDEKETSTPTEADALAKEEMPNLLGEACSD